MERRLQQTKLDGARYNFISRQPSNLDAKNIAKTGLTRKLADRQHNKPFFGRTRNTSNLNGKTTVSSTLNRPAPIRAKRSKVAHIPDKFHTIPDGVYNIFEDDCYDDTSFAGYGANILNYMFHAESTFVPNLKEKLEKSNLRPKMRTILIDWMASVHFKFRMQVDTLFLAIDLTDRMLGYAKVEKDELQLLGVTSLFTASKFEEIYPPDIDDYVFMADGSCTKSEILSLEMVIYKILGFTLWKPLECKFLRIFDKIRSVPTNEDVYPGAKFFLEVAKLSDFKHEFLTSQIAAAAYLCSLCLVSSNLCFHEPNEPQVVWTREMSFWTTYKLHDLIGPLSIILQDTIEIQRDKKLSGIVRKYSSQAYENILFSPRMKNSMMEALCKKILSGEYAHLFIQSKKSRIQVTADALPSTAICSSW